MSIVRETPAPLFHRRPLPPVRVGVRPPAMIPNYFDDEINDENFAAWYLVVALERRDRRDRENEATA